MLDIKGRPLCAEERRAIVTLKEYFDRNKAMLNIRDSSTQMVADALGVGLATVDRVMANYRKDPNSIYTVAPPRTIQR